MMKMNKIIMAALMSVFMFYGHAYADDAAVGVASMTNSTVSNIDHCTLLSTSVRLELSTNVSGAVYCGSPTAGDNTQNMIFYGTCHGDGSNKDRSYTCTAADAAAGTNGCTAADEVVTITGRAAYLGSSNGGVIGLNDLQNTVCSNANITTRVNTQASDCIAAASSDDC